MDQTTHEVPSGFVWPTVGHPGRVPLWAIVPNPHQPRKEFDEEELNALAFTMRVENGGEQREIVAVRALSQEELEEYHPARYMLISGERRWRAAQRAELDDLEIRVKRYTSFAFEKLDMYMLNEARVGLGDIERSDYLVSLMKDFNLSTQEELGRLVGEEQATISQFLALQKLSPRVRAAMSSSVPRYARLKRQVGVFLSHLSHEIQDTFLDGMPKDRAPATQQIRWMQAQLVGMGITLPTKTQNPSDLRELVQIYAAQVERRAGELLAKQGFDERLFSNAPRAKGDEVLGNIKDAQAELNDFVDKVIALHKAAYPDDARAAPSAPVFTPVRKIQEGPRTPVVSRPVQKPAFVAPKPPPAPAPAEVEEDDEIATPVRPKPRPMGAPFKEVQQKHNRLGVAATREITVNYWDESAGRMVTNKVSLDRYVELWNSGGLQFQQRKLPKPEHLPTVEEAMEEILKVKGGR